ncbi:MAG: transposase [Verrucomicrobiae bacterium]
MRQLCIRIPNYLVPHLARAHAVVERSRTFRPWSHVVSLIYAQLTHSLGLNDVCDALRLHSGPLSAILGATAPSKNALSHANRERNPKMAEALFWTILWHLQQLHPGFGARRRPKLAFRFKRLNHIVDSTTIPLVANSLDWAKHRRRKAAAKCHVRLNLQIFLPRFALVDTAGEHDKRRAHELCARVQAGEIVIFDKAYAAFAHLADLSQREVFWVTRLFTLIRSALCQLLDLRQLPDRYGTAGGSGRFLGTPQKAYLPCLI